MFNPIDTLLREIEELKKKVQKLEDDQIKQNRDYKDAMYNLDTDNIPALQGVVKKVNLIISEGGTVTAQFVMEVINNESNAKINADRINLEGLVLNLTANNITISSDNFSVDKNGHVVMASADIKQNCVLGSDLTTGAGMQIGPDYEENGKSIKTRLVLIEETDEILDTTTKGVAFETRDRVSNAEAYLGNVESNNYGASVRMYKETYNSRGELSGIDLLSAASAGRDEAELSYGDARVYANDSYVRLEFDNVYLQVDGQGVHCGNGKNTMEIYQAL